MKLMEHLSKKYVPRVDSSPTPQPLPIMNGRSYELSGLQMKELDISKVQKTSPALPTSLNLAQNQLRELPNDFHELSRSLVSLSLNKNQLTAFPALSNCSNLVVYLITNDYLLYL